MALFEALVEALEAKEQLESEQAKGVGPARMEMAERNLKVAAEAFEEEVRAVIRDEIDKATYGD
jgi:hypothetical protein